MSSFNYQLTPTMLTALERGLSSNRLGRYVAMSGGDKEAAMRLYTWNAAVSESLYGPLQAFEILTRNRIHDAMTVRLGATWYDTPGLLDHGMQQKLTEAKSKLLSAQKLVSPPSVVSELSLGFWTSLLSRKHEPTFWLKHRLFTLFVNRPVRKSRIDVFADYDDARKLRNRIAHHECVISQALPGQYATIEELIHSHCPDTGKWFAHHSRFGAVWHDTSNPWLPAVAPVTPTGAVAAAPVPAPAVVVVAKP